MGRRVVLAAPVVTEGDGDVARELRVDRICRKQLRQLVCSGRAEPVSHRVQDLDGQRREDGQAEALLPRELIPMPLLVASRAEDQRAVLTDHLRRRDPPQRELLSCLRNGRLVGFGLPGRGAPDAKSP